jgi:hypothetical protein
MVKINGNDEGGYECLWWVEYGGVHFPEATLPGMFSARGAGGHYVLVVPSLDLIIVHRTDNEPPISRNKVASDASRFFFVAIFFCDRILCCGESLFCDWHDSPHSDPVCAGLPWEAGLICLLGGAEGGAKQMQNGVWCWSQLLVAGSECVQ